MTMTKDEARAYIRACAEDEGPETYTEAAEIFAVVIGRAPSDEDGDAGELWSHVCAAVQPTTAFIDGRDTTHGHALLSLAWRLVYLGAAEDSIQKRARTSHVCAAVQPTTYRASLRYETEREDTTIEATSINAAIILALAWVDDHDWQPPTHRPRAWLFVGASDQSPVDDMRIDLGGDA